MFRTILVSLLAAFALNAFAAVDANRATQAELEAVKGVGPGLSGRIIQAREVQSFKDWNDLVDRVGGVGHGNAARLSQAGLTVGGSAYDPATKPAPAPKAPRAAKAEKSADKPARTDRTAKTPKTGG
ncbi:MAG: helix-hairpin-helix domain-containing protein [Rubrivivax sp.]|nr:helix-hairpin-helix domain-containing protein [Rubrivivax sp.]